MRSGIVSAACTSRRPRRRPAHPPASARHGRRGWGQAGYATDAPYLTEAGARWLAGHDALLVGIDSVNIDDVQSGGHRPAHSVLLQAGIPVVEHLTGLGQLPATGFWFTAAPVPLAGVGSFPVRAYATIPGP
jgi:kynurenine formamidase